MRAQVNPQGTLISTHSKKLLTMTDTDTLIATTATQPTLAASPDQTLRSRVTNAPKLYFSQLDGTKVTELYDLVLAEVEAPLLEVVLEQVKGNQTKAAAMLGLSRGTLRKKLKQYDLG